MVAFLYDFKRGHCEYFAGAMTLMCQSLKIPARMVIGFRCDDFNNVGGFYRVEKQKVPNVMPEKLHWFRWEAAITWLSGILLLFMVYFHGGLMINSEDSPINQGTAVGLSIGLLIAAWPMSATAPP